MTGSVSTAARVSARQVATLLGRWNEPDRPSSAALSTGLRALMLDGQLPAGTRLPAERELATALRTSRNLVTAALDRLREQDLVASRHGAGTWVTTTSRPAWPATGENDDAIDLSHAAPAAPPELAAAYERAAHRMGGQLRGHGYLMRGLGPLRERVAARLTARGLPTDAGQVVITNGAQAAIRTAMRVLSGPGSAILLENPTYCNALGAMRALRLRPVAMSVDAAGGWDTDGAIAGLRQSAPALAYLVPDHSNPTGVRVPAAQRAELAAELLRRRCPAIIDETLAELTLDGEPEPPMGALLGDAAITVGSLSKSVWGGLRVGWLRAGREIVEQVAAQRPAVDLGTAVFEQIVADELHDDLDAVLAARRESLRQRRDLLIGQLAAALPGWRVPVPAGGQVLWCLLDAPASTRLTVLATGYGLRLSAGSAFGVAGGFERRLRLPFTLPPAQLVTAVGRLAAAWNATGAGPAPDLPDATVSL
jgi:DNA-binding transcriptional MocR family regulator